MLPGINMELKTKTFCSVSSKELAVLTVFVKSNQNVSSICKPKCI